MAVGLHRVRAIGVRRLVIGFVVLIVGIAASVSGYVASRHSTNQEAFFGDFDNPDRVEVTAWITKVDTAAETLSMTIVGVRPYGSLADPDGNFARDATLFTNAVGTWRAPSTRATRHRISSSALRSPAR